MPEEQKVEAAKEILSDYYYDSSEVFNSSDQEHIDKIKKLILNYVSPGMAEYIQQQSFDEEIEKKKC